jgi:hypothetical protein
VVTLGTLDLRNAGLFRHRPVSIPQRERRGVVAKLDDQSEVRPVELPVWRVDHDAGDGQNLVVDTGMADGRFTYLRVGVYGGSSIPGRDDGAVTIAAEVAIGEAPPGPPPD